MRAEHVRAESATELDELHGPLADAVRRCVESSGLTGSARTSLARELAAHMLDARDAGLSEQRIVHEFGDPELAGALIRRVRGAARRRSRLALKTVVTLGAAAMLAMYVESAVTLHTHSPALAATSADRDEIQRLAESPVDLDATSRILARLLDRMYSEEGSLTARGLRIVQRLKGVERPTRAALVVEPAYFALPASRADVDREWRRIVRVARTAREAGLGSDAWRELEAEVARYSWATREGFRYAPLAIVLPRLMVAMRAEASLSVRVPALGLRSE
jgi:hypothetical protein